MTTVKKALGGASGRFHCHTSWGMKAWRAAVKAYMGRRFGVKDPDVDYRALIRKKNPDVVFPSDLA